MAHPDDAEFICGGTIAKWAAAGIEVFMVLGTRGDKGTSDATKTHQEMMDIREAEQHEAARILGAKEVEFLGFRDAELVPDLQLREAVTRVIRKYRPDALICQDPTARWSGQEYIQHPDHLAMGEASLAAVFPSARDPLTFPQLLAEGLEPHKVAEVYVASPREPEVWVDISESFPTKIEALRAHRSQIGDWDPESMLRRWAEDTAALARHHRFPGADEMRLAENFKYFHLS
jgi:LmbE family N-acetylglucosaminyl deacetylase